MALTEKGLGYVKHTRLNSSAYLKSWMTSSWSRIRLAKPPMTLFTRRPQMDSSGQLLPTSSRTEQTAARTMTLALMCRVYTTQKKNELDKLEKQLKIADQKLSSEGRQLETLEHKAERLDGMREVSICNSCSLLDLSMDALLMPDTVSLPDFVV